MVCRAKRNYTKDQRGAFFAGSGCHGHTIQFLVVVDGVSQFNGPASHQPSYIVEEMEEHSQPGAFTARVSPRLLHPITVACGGRRSKYSLRSFLSMESPSATSSTLVVKITRAALSRNYWRLFQESPLNKSSLNWK